MPTERGMEREKEIQREKRKIEERETLLRK